MLLGGTREFPSVVSPHGSLVTLNTAGGTATVRSSRELRLARRLGSLEEGKDEFRFGLGGMACGAVGKQHTQWMVGKTGKESLTDKKLLGPWRGNTDTLLRVASGLGFGLVFNLDWKSLKEFCHRNPT